MVGFILASIGPMAARVPYGGLLLLDMPGQSCFSPKTDQAQFLAMKQYLKLEIPTFVESKIWQVKCIHQIEYVVRKLSPMKGETVWEPMLQEVS